MNKEAMRLALEALEGSTDKTLSIRAITALQKALAQPQQEPFIYYRHYDGGTQDYPDEKTIPLYTSTPAQEFVCSTGLCHYRKPLTDEQVSAIWKAVPNQALYEAVIVFARAIEAAHKIKGDT